MTPHASTGCRRQLTKPKLIPTVGTISSAPSASDFVKTLIVPKLKPLCRHVLAVYRHVSSHSLVHVIALKTYPTDKCCHSVRMNHSHIVVILHRRRALICICRITQVSA